jgi:COP9 signalosome complex subunit 3
VKRSAKLTTMDPYLTAARNFAGFVNNGSDLTTGVAKEYLDNIPRYVDNFGRAAYTVLDDGITRLTNEARPDKDMSLAILGLLTAKAKSNELTNNLDAFTVQVTGFLNGLQEGGLAQIRLCPILLVDCCQRIADLLLSRKTPMQGINLLSLGIRCLQGNNTKQLTGLHAILLELCLSATCFKAAFPYLVDDIDEFSTELKAADAKSILLYYYYGGMIFTGLKKYTQALFFFEACTHVPGATLSHIMLEAYKKFVLVSLIEYGEVPQPTKACVQVVNRILRHSAVPYNELASAFASHNPGELNNIIVRNQEAFQTDRNFGLVKQVRSAQTKLNIQRLTKTFLTLSLADVASRAQLPGGAAQAEKYLLNMIQDGEIYAKINQRDGMVIFLDPKEKYDSPRMMKKMEDQITVCIGLNKRLTEMNEKLTTNPDYVSKISHPHEDEGISSSKIPSFVM